MESSWKVNWFCRFLALLLAAEVVEKTVAGVVPHAFFIRNFPA
jgi:hypothetical protein